LQDGEEEKRFFLNYSKKIGIQFFHPFFFKFYFYFGAFVGKKLGNFKNGVLLIYKQQQIFTSSRNSFFFLKLGPFLKKK